MKKADLRKELIKTREAQTKEELIEKSGICVKKLEKLFLEYLGKYKNNILKVCAYYPLNNEIDLREFYVKLLKKEYDTKELELKLLFPRVDKKKMNFYIVNSFDELEKGNFNVMEPKKFCTEVPDIDNAFVITPCVGIHKDKVRMGYGGGYYDRYFADKKNNYLLGVSHDFAKELDFEYEAYDIKMDSII